MNVHAILGPTRPKRRIARRRRAADRGPLKRRGRRSSGLERLMNRVTCALRERVGGSKAAAHPGRERAEGRAPAFKAAARRVWTEGAGVTSMARRHGRVDRGASPGAGRGPATTHRAKRRARALVGAGVDRLARRR
jgi:hypothetical protein